MSKLTHMMLREVMKDIEPHGKTAKTYINAVKNNFDPWAKEHCIKNLRQVDRIVIQDYADHLKSSGYSPATIHTYISPICKAVHISMFEIVKPRRTSGAITRGRGGDVGRRGRADAKKEENKRLVHAAKAIGIRRDEYSRLRGRDLSREADGYLYVHVKKGKGGKEQYQRILPEHEKVVLGLFGKTEPDKYVFSKAEIDRSQSINLHGYRADVAKEAYEYYKHRIDSEPGYKKVLRRQLIERFADSHITSRQKNDGSVGKRETFGSKISSFKGNKSFERALHNFKREMDMSGEYVTRSDNRRRCQAKGIPWKFDRTALLAVSVFHLSHWRNDVTVTNYLTW